MTTEKSLPIVVPFCVVLFALGTVAVAEAPYEVKWVRQMGTRTWDKSYSAAVDGAGGVYITGYSSGSLCGPSAGTSDALLARYDPSGNLLWCRQIGTANEDNSLSVAVDGVGGVYISGRTEGSLGGSYAGRWDAFLVKYDASGNLLWSRQMGTPERDYSNSVAVDGAGGVYISGYTEGSLGGPNAGEGDAFLIKYDASGNLLWSRQIGTSSNEWSFSVAANGAGGVYIGGKTTGSLGGPNAGGDDALLAKYDASGNLLWSQQIGTPYFDESHSVAVDGMGGVYISGWTWGSLGAPHAGATDALLVKFGPKPVAADIKPGSWPNPLNLNSRGVLPAALCGTEAFDVMDIDPATILLGREGLVGGVAPLRWGYEDVCTPFDGEPCDGHELGPDGFTDLTLKFSVQELVDALALADLAGETIPLLLSGSLLDGTPWAGSDCVWVLRPGDANLDGVVDALDYNRWSLHYLRRGGWSVGNFNADDLVDGLDYNLWSLNYGPAAGAAPVPEPAFALVLIAGLGPVLSRRRSR